MAELDFEPRVKTFTMLEIARKAWGKDWTKPDPGYEFTGRTFETPTYGGPYAPEDVPE
jgi:hypothetical protein